MIIKAIFGREDVIAGGYFAFSQVYRMAGHMWGTNHFTVIG